MSDVDDTVFPEVATIKAAIAALEAKPIPSIERLAWFDGRLFRYKNGHVTEVHDTEE